MKATHLQKQNNDISINHLIEICSGRLDTLFHDYLHAIPSVKLKNAMAYTLFNGGKRLRPLLIYATGFIFDALLPDLDLPAASVELIHTYSLIHDDLPCMDNAELRRGKPACHKEHGEGFAVLTGDALHTLAMQILANHEAKLSAAKRIEMISTLAQACGPYGMAAGQALDISMMDDESISLDLLSTISELKTGALLSACIRLGWLASNDDDDFNEQSLKKFGDRIGLAFQIQDDILDIESDSITSGKTQNLDSKNNKITYPQRVGLMPAKDLVESLYEEALESINYLGTSASLLRKLAEEMLRRKK